MTSANFNPFAGGELLRVTPTTRPQKEIIASAQLNDVANTAFNEAVSVRLSGPLDQDRLADCLDDLIRKHDILRATFSRSGAEICLHEKSPFELDVEDLSALSSNEQEARIRELWQNIALSPMNLEEGPLFFAWLKKLDSATHELIIAAHHIICDGWSIGLMLSELSERYANRRAFDDASPDDISFFDYAELIDSREIGNKDNDYWVQQFADLPPNLDLPLDFPRPHFRTFEAARLDYTVNPELARRLPKVAASMKVSLVNMVLAAYFVLLHRLSSSEDIVVGLPVAGQATQNRPRQVGHMVHLLPIRIKLDANTPFSELCQRVKEEVLTATEHSQFTFGKLIESINVDRTRVPLISTIFNIDQPLDAIDFGEVTGTVRTVPRAAENFEIFLNILPSSESLTLEATYSTALFREATINSWLSALEQILASCTDELTVPIGEVPLATGEPEMITQVNATGRALEHANVVEAFRQRVGTHPQGTACVFNDHQLSYKDLDRQSDLVATNLSAQGIGTGDTVALCIDRSEKVLAAILGIFKTGAVYLPLDPGFPEARLKYMLEDSGAAAIVIDQDTSLAIDELNIKRIPLALLTKGLADGSDSTFQAARLDPNQTAYIIYTSGSTGNPKGVLIPHLALSNFLESMASAPGFSDKDRLLAVTTLSFDISMLELLLPVTQGGVTVIADKNAVKDGEQLRQLIQAHAISVMQATPAMWRMLLDTDWQHDDSDMKGLCGGEPLPPDLARELLGSLKELWNMYGPTETTVWSTCHRLRATEKQISVGKPIDNTQVHILDRKRHPLPVSCPGELFIGGLGLAKGYHKRPELTSEKYIDHPDFGRLYSTGDLAKWCPNGDIQHLGRLDDQVKVRGYRIELGDIESALKTCPDVRAACAYVWEVGPGDARIVGCVVTESQAEPNIVAIRKELRGLLPNYMIPQYFLSVDSIPLSPSGKIDRRKLPRPELRESSILKASALANPTEEMVAEIWAKVLNSATRIVREDNFFSLGGHSLLALQVIRQIENNTGIRLAPEDIVSLSLSEIADKIAHSKPAEAEHEDSPADLPAASARSLSREQTRLLLRQLSFPDNVCNNLPASWLLNGQLDTDIFTRSLEKVMERQTALRTVITRQNGEFQQAVLPIRQVPVLEVVDLRGAATPQETALEQARELAFKAFKVLDRPLFRSTLYVLGESSYYYAFVPHQLIFDGWSFDIFLKELEQAYLTLTGAENESATRLPFQFKDFAEWSLTKGASNEDLDFHKAQLASLLKQEPSADEDNANQQACTRETLNFSEDNLETLVTSAGHLNLKLHEMLFCLFAEASLRAWNTPSVVLGVPSAGRHRADVINLVGSFVTTIPCVLEVQSTGLRDRITSLARQLREALAHQKVTYADIVQNTPQDQNLFPTSVQASFAFQDIRNRPTLIADLGVEQVDLPRLHTEYPIEFWTRVQPGGFAAVFDYEPTPENQARVRQLRDVFSDLVLNVESLKGEESPQLEQPDITLEKRPFWRKLFG